MPRKPNYGFDKRRKEQDRKAKKDAKQLEKQQRRQQEAALGNATPDADAGDAQTPPAGADTDS